MSHPKAQANRFGYEEPAPALNNRIGSHKKFSDFDLHSWIRENFPFKKGDNVIDIGCGNGNYTDLFWEKVGPEGHILGIDKNQDLITEAKKIHASKPNEHVAFVVGDFDHPFPIPAVLTTPLSTKKAQWIFSIYSLYYTVDPNRVLSEVKRYLAKGGSFVVIGPGPENALDLVDINEKLTGNRPNKAYFERLSRILLEFSPLFKKTFGSGSVTEYKMNSVMSFPTEQAFADYYWSTLLWRESIGGRPPDQVQEVKNATMRLASNQLPMKILKQISCVVVQNP